jgi:hypothetical protein
MCGLCEGLCLSTLLLLTPHTSHIIAQPAGARARVCSSSLAAWTCATFVCTRGMHIRATPHTREILNRNPSIRAGRARAGRLQNPSRAGRPCRISEPSRAGRRPFRSEPSRAEHRQPKIRAVARLGSVRSLVLGTLPNEEGGSFLGLRAKLFGLEGLIDYCDKFERDMFGYHTYMASDRTEPSRATARIFGGRCSAQLGSDRNTVFVSHYNQSYI